MSKCKDIQASLEAYSLQALSEAEMRDVESHLESCADCRQYLASYQQTLESLALEGSDFEITENNLPTGHLARFQAKLVQRPQLPPVAVHPVPVPVIALPIPAPGSARPARVKWQVLGLAAALLIMIGLGLQLWNLQDQLDRQNRQNQALTTQVQNQNTQLTGLSDNLQSQKKSLGDQLNQLTTERDGLQRQINQLNSIVTNQTNLTQNVAVLLTKPGATTRSVEKGTEQVGLTVLMAPSEKEAALFMRDLPGLAQGQEYRVWLYDNSGKLVSGGTIKIVNASDQSVNLAVIQVPQPMSDYTELWITQEKPGAQTPSGPEVIRDKLA